MTEPKTLSQLEDEIRERELLEVESAAETAQMMGSYFANEQLKMLTRDGLIPATYKARQVWLQLIAMRSKLAAVELSDYLGSAEPAIAREALHQMVRLKEARHHAEAIGKILRKREDHGYKTVMCEAAIVLGRLGNKEALDTFDMTEDYHEGIVVECIQAARKALENPDDTTEPPYLNGWPAETKDL